VSRNNELKKNDTNDNDRRKRAPHEFPGATDNDAPPTVEAVKMFQIKQEGHSPEREWEITSRTTCFGFHLQPHIQPRIIRIYKMLAF